MPSKDMDLISQSYNASANLLAERILAFIPAHPEIMEFKDPYQLFRVEGFKCDDIGPSYFQASWALNQAMNLYKEQNAR